MSPRAIGSSRSSTSDVVIVAAKTSPAMPAARIARRPVSGGPSGASMSARAYTAGRPSRQTPRRNPRAGVCTQGRLVARRVPRRAQQQRGAMTDIATAPPEEAGLVPGWLQRLAAIGWRLLVAIALGLVLLEIAVMLSTVTVSILVAAIVAATFAPFVLALRKRGWSRIKAAAAVFLGAAAVIIATLVIIAIAFIPYIAAAVDAITTSLATLQARLAEVNVPPEVGHAIDR